MNFREGFLMRYLSQAPVALAFERVLECRLYPSLPFDRPILDIGCGEGLFAKMLFEEKIDTGVDPNARELKRACQLGSYSELLECRGDKIAKPDGFYRTAFSNSVLEHIPDVKPVISEVRRLLAPGGRFYVTVPSDKFEQYTVGNQFLAGLGMKGLAAKFRLFFNRFWAHYHTYPLEGWQALARECGFEVVDSFTYDPKRVCVFNDFAAPFGAGAMILKKLFNRWVLFPWLRYVLLAPMVLFGRLLLKGGERAENGGLVFLHLRKPTAP